MSHRTIPRCQTVLVLLGFLCCSCNSHRTNVSIKGDQFYINGALTYPQTTWQGNKIEGLLFNSRMVQGIFDDLNPATRSSFAYPDTKTWDAERNTNEFILAMDDWYKQGLVAITLNLQGGSPIGYGRSDCINSAFDPQGSLRPEYLQRLELILNKADRMGMVVILGLFYFGQDQHLEDETAVLNATDQITQWILDKGYRNILIEINNECDINYDHAILQPDRVYELMDRVREKSRNQYPLLLSTSFSGGKIPTTEVVQRANFVLLHGNGVSSSNQLSRLIDSTRKLSTYHSQPIVINEDDHFNFESDTCNFVTAVKGYASWGYFDYRMKNEEFRDGYQSIPVDWGIRSERKIKFFNKLKEITGKQ